jgi:hypothetical protein
MLDPKSPAEAGRFWTPQGETSEVFRDFGKFPNIQDWLPGDVVLVGSIKPDWVTRRIVATQLKNYDQAHAQWQHAAIYMGNGFLAEATTHGVKYTPLQHYVGEYFIKVRRHSSLTPDERWLVAIEAGVRLREAYRFSDIVTIYRRTFPGLSRQIRPNVLVQANSVICSQLCQDAHAKVTGRLIVSLAINPVVPAALSQTTLLEDVYTCWCSIR